MPTAEILHQARSWGNQGGDSAFFTLVKRLRPADLLPMRQVERLRLAVLRR